MIDKSLNFRSPMIMAPLLAVLVAFVAQFGGLLQGADGALYDLRMEMVRHATTTHPDVAVVMIDDATLHQLEPEFGRWPWPRSVYAELLNFLAAGSARAVAFDILFSESERGCQCAGQSSGQNDALLAQATADHGGVYHAAVVTNEQPNEYNAERLNRALPTALAEHHLLVVDGEPPAEENSYLLPIDAVLQSARGVGVVEVMPDSDGTYRHVQLLRNYGGKLFPSMGIAPVANGPQAVSLGLNGASLVWEGVSVPVGPQTRFAINYYGDYQTHSFAKLLQSARAEANGGDKPLAVRAEDFRDKIVLIGASAAGLADLKSTPLNDRLPGVYMHAAVMSHFLEADFLSESGNLVAMVWIVLSAGITLLVWRAVPAGPIRVVAVLLVGAVLFFGSLVRFYLNVADPLAAALLAWLLVSVMLLASRGERGIAGQSADVGVTGVPVSESATVLHLLMVGAEPLSGKIESLLADMRALVRASGGVVAASAWPELVAFWPAEMASASNQTTLDVVTGMPAELQRTLVESELVLHVGIATGDVTLLHDDSGLAGAAPHQARAAALAAQRFGREMGCVGESFAAREDWLLMDRVRLFAGGEAMEVYRPMSAKERSAAGSPVGNPAELWREAHEHYAARRWQEALDLLRLLPDGREKQVLMERCERWRQSEPPQDWDGAAMLGAW